MMSKETREHISCLMDGEISREASRFLVRRLGADDELCATWARYHMVRDCLRHQDGGFAGDDLCNRVSQALENEAPRKASRKLSLGWLKPAAGAAIAASVALMAVVMVGPGNPGIPQPDGNLVDNVAAEQFTSPQSLAPAPISRQVSLSGGTQGDRRMNSYLLRHYQASGSTGVRGFVAFVPIVVTGAAGQAGEDNREHETEQQAEKGEESQSQ